MRTISNQTLIDAFRNMTAIAVQNCDVGGAYIAAAYGDAWIMPDHDENCETGVVIINGTDPCPATTPAEANAVCQPIKDAITQTGVFANCSALGADVIDQLYKECAYDYCQLATRPQLCEVHNFHVKQRSFIIV